MNHGRDELKLKPGALIGLLPLRSGAAPQINIVLNWFEDLKERVPVP